VRSTAALLLVFAAGAAPAQTAPPARVADDARVIDRVAEASKKDLPIDLLKRIVNEDIDLLRVKRADGSYQYAGYDKMEAGRISDSYSVQPEKKEDVLELRGAFVYRLVISAPSRRMVVTRNKHVYVDRAEIEYIPLNDPAKKFQTSRIAAWIEPGTSKNIELNEIARQATVRLYTHADESGYGNLDLTFIQAKIFDDPTSPYADAVASEKAILQALDHNDVASIRAMAQRIASTLQPNVAAAVAAVPVRPPAATMEVTASKSDAEIYAELQSIEDLLTGSDSERRQGLDKLHQLVRRLRTASR
jgi:hypothetical protein